MSDIPIVREVNGELVIDDPVAEGVLAAVNAHNRDVARENCQKLFRANAERVRHFVNRIAERQLSPSEVVVVVVDVDDIPNGRGLAEVLMPHHDWQVYRDRGESPIARGLAARSGFQDIATQFWPEVGATLRATSDVAILVVASGTAAVYTVKDLETDQFGFSPDCDRYVIRNGMVYTEHGSVFAVSIDSMFREMPVPYGSHENYADWTEDQRNRRKAEVVKAREDAAQAQRDRLAERERLVESGRAKLTPEEFDAIVASGQEF